MDSKYDISIFNKNLQYKNLKIKSKNKVKTLYITFFLSILLSFAVHYFKLDYIESYLYDLRVDLKPTSNPSQFIETVFIDSTTIEELKTKPTFAQHIQLLNKLLPEEPLAVVYVLNPKEIDGTSKEKIEFVNTAIKFKNFFHVSKSMSLKGEEGSIDFTDELKPIKVVGGPLTSDSTLLAKDGVTRRMILTYQDQILLHLQLASLALNKDITPQSIKGSFDFFDTLQTYIDFHPSKSYPRWSFSQIYDQKFQPNRFKNKIIFIGVDLGTNPKDYIMTPYSREINAMTAVEAHANMLDTLIKNSSPIQIPNFVNILFSFIISLITIYVVLAMSPIKGLFILGINFGIFTILSFILFYPFNYWVDMAHPLLTIFISYYFFIPYRLIIENRRSWELYEKNKLLTQVEELKNNFISMMSHDLKTPLARIQGMAEVISRDKKSVLTDDQQDAVKTIQQSSDELLNFISSILNFSRIESHGVKLNIKSKDINALIEEVLKKYEFLTYQKKIKFKKNLEPLFSIRIDPELIRQVLSNLIENAVKYSPENSEVTISSEELEGSVVVKVADQGIGIPEEELSSIFMKFYRSKNAKSSQIKGSGLGLYLAKYFIELHKGTIDVESTGQTGTVFRVILPLDGAS